MPELTIFLSGALVMALEMVGARVLAPHVGTSAIVWTSMIGVVLAFLALGAWAGGRYADRHLSRRGLSLALALAGASTAASALLHASIGQAAQAIGNLHAAAVCAATGIFALPAFFFGSIGPYIIRLRMASLDNAGATVGRLYALSTAGSIAGTFLGGFVLISFMGSTAILWCIALAMLLLSLLNWPRKSAFRVALLALCALCAWLGSQGKARTDLASGGQILIESPYNTIRVMDGIDRLRGPGAVRLMATDPGYSQSGMLRSRPNELYFEYTRFYALAPWLAPEARSVLMLGGGGFSAPKWLLSGKSMLGNPRDLGLTVVELDPAMTRTAKEWFGLPDDPRLDIVHEDARAFLNRQNGQFDIILVDVFNSHYSVPFQMGTRQAAAQLARALAPDGVMMMNVISAVDGPDGRLARSIIQAMRESFASVHVYCVGRPDRPDLIQNLMLLARHGEAARPENARARPHADPPESEIRSMAAHLYPGLPAEATPALDDDFAPVERYSLMLGRMD